MTTLASALAWAAPALATPITGSDTVSASVTGSNEVGSNLGSATSFNLGSASESFAPSGIGAFSVIPVGTTVPLAAALLNLNNASSFGFTSATVGTFNPSTLSVYNQTATSLSAFLTGGFTPGSLFPSGTLTPASENLVFTQAANGAISVTGTFSTPAAPSPVPEPLPIGLIGVGLLGIAALRYRRRAGQLF